VPGLGLFGLLYVNKLLDYILSLNYNLSANPLTLMHKEYMSGANFRVWKFDPLYRMYLSVKSETY